MPNKARMILRSFQNLCLEDVAILNVGRKQQRTICMPGQLSFLVGVGGCIFGRFPFVVRAASPVKMHLPQLSPRPAESILGLSTLPRRASTTRNETALTQKCYLHNTRPMHRACWFDVLDTS